MGSKKKAHKSAAETDKTEATPAPAVTVNLKPAKTSGGKATAQPPEPIVATPEPAPAPTLDVVFDRLGRITLVKEVVEAVVEGVEWAEKALTNPHVQDLIQGVAQIFGLGFMDVRATATYPANASFDEQMQALAELMNRRAKAMAVLRTVLSQHESLQKIYSDLKAKQQKEFTQALLEHVRAADARNRQDGVDFERYVISAFANELLREILLAVIAQGEDRPRKRPL